MLYPRFWRWVTVPFSRCLNHEQAHVSCNTIPYDFLYMEDAGYSLTHFSKESFTNEFFKFHTYASESLLKYVDKEFFLSFHPETVSFHKESLGIFSRLSFYKLAEQCSNKQGCKYAKCLMSNSTNPICFQKEASQTLKFCSMLSEDILETRIQLETELPAILLNMWKLFFYSLKKLPILEDSQPMESVDIRWLLLLQETINCFLPKEPYKRIICLAEIQKLFFTQKTPIHLRHSYYAYLPNTFWNIFIDVCAEEIRTLESKIGSECPTQKDPTMSFWFVQNILLEKIIPLCVQFYITKIHSVSGIHQAQLLSRVSKNVIYSEPVEIEEAFSLNEAISLDHLHENALQRIISLLFKSVLISSSLPVSAITLETITNTLEILLSLKKRWEDFPHDNSARLAKSPIRTNYSMNEFLHPNIVSEEKHMMNALYEFYPKIVQWIETEEITMPTLHCVALWLSAWRLYIEEFGKGVPVTHNFDRIIFKVYSKLVDYRSENFLFYKELFGTLSKYYDAETMEMLFVSLIRRLNKTLLDHWGYHLKQSMISSWKRLSLSLLPSVKLSLSGSLDESFSNTPEKKKKFITSRTMHRNCLIRELQILSTLIQGSPLKFPLELFEKQGGGAILSALLEFKMERLTQEKDYAERAIMFSKQDKNPLGIILNILAHLVTCTQSNAKLSGWFFFSWQEALRIQSTLARILSANNIFPKLCYKSSHGHRANDSYSLKQNLHLDRNSKIPPSFIYYNAKRLQLNIEQVWTPYTLGVPGVYSPEVIPFYIKNPTLPLDFLNFMLTTKFQQAAQKDLELQQHMKYNVLPSKFTKFQQTSKNDCIPLDVIFLHGLRGSGLKTWRWEQHESWIYSLTDRFPPAESTEQQKASTKPPMLYFESFSDTPNQQNSLYFLRRSENQNFCDLHPHYRMDIPEPKNYDIWYFHWPQLFLPKSLPSSSRILAVNMIMPLFKDHYFLSRKNREDFRTVGNQFSKVVGGLKNFLFYFNNFPLDLKTFLHHSPLNTLIPFVIHLDQVKTIKNITENVTYTDMTLAQLAQILKSRLENAQVVDMENSRNASSTPLRHIVWITHSMGGLIVKKLLLNDKRFAERTRGIVFMGVPHFGSPLSKEFEYFEALLPQYCRELHPKRYKLSFERLNEEFRKLCVQYNIPILSFAEDSETPLPYISQLSYRYKRHIVPPQFANPNYGFFFLLPHVDHTKICRIARPDDRLLLLTQLISSASQKQSLDHSSRDSFA